MTIRKVDLFIDNMKSVIIKILTFDGVFLKTVNNIELLYIQ